MKQSQSRWHFAMIWALRHAGLSLAVATLAAILVYQFWYPMPYRAMLGVGGIFVVLLCVDVVCGPLLTLLLASPRKSGLEMSLDLTVIGAIQAAALVYGLHAVWIGRPVVLAFERDRMTVVSANEIESTDLPAAPAEFRQLPFGGILQVATRKPKDNTEFIQSIDLSLAGLPPAMRPAWWQPMRTQQEQMRTVAKPLTELVARRPEQADELRIAAAKSGYSVEALSYLPLTSSKTKDWVAFFNDSMEMVGHAPVDGF